MRNLKRVLSLALALVMILGMMVMGAGAASADFVDANEIDYVEAVDVLTGLGVLDGVKNSNGTYDFNPDEILTREQAAKIICYILMGKDNADKLPKNQAIFKDVAAGRWSAGYISYCANLGILAGYGDGNYGPTDQLTGVQFGKLLLVAAGYDATAEGYVGKNWATNIGTDMIANGIDIDGVAMAAPLAREQAAQMVLQAMYMGIVKYTTAYDYATGAQTLIGPSPVYNDYYDNEVYGYGQLLFKDKYWDNLYKVNYSLFEEQDDWGNPVKTQWIWGDDILYSKNYDPVVVYTTAKTDCQIAVDLKLAKDIQYTSYVDGFKYENVTLDVDDIDYVNNNTTGTGVLTKVYKNGTQYSMVSVNTYFAQVTDVTDKVVDIGGHVVADAYATLTVYSDATGWEGLTYKTESLAKDQYVLVNMLYNGTVKVVAPATYVNGTVASTTYAALPINGTVTTAAGTYTENVKFFVGKEPATKTNYNLYMDSYNNVIAAVVPASSSTYAYGVMTAAKWVDSNDLLDAGYALANIMKMDATLMPNVKLVANNVVSKDLAYAENGVGAYADATMATSTQYNGAYYGILFQYIMNPDGVTYDINATAIIDHTLTSITQKVPTVRVNGTGYAATNDNTVYLVKTAANTYVTYTGYKNVPSMTNLTTAQYFVKDGYITMMYVDATGATFTGSNEIVYISTVNGVTKTAESNGLYGFDVYVGTTKTTLYAASSYDVATSYDGMGGIYKVSYNAKGEVIGLTNYFASGMGINLAGVDYCNGTVIEDVATGTAYNCTGAQIYKMTSAGTVVAGKTSDLKNDITAYMVTDASNAIVAIYYFG